MSPTTEHIAITSLADEIAFRLQAAILAGEHPPGTHLFQDEICERFGVSRTPVREALRKLQAMHLVVLVPNKGATVRVPGRDELIDVYNVRAELESYACELACVNASPELLAEISRLFIDDAPRHLERIRRALDARDGESLRRAAHGLKGAAANFDAIPPLPRPDPPAPTDTVSNGLSATTSLINSAVESVRGSAVNSPGVSVSSTNRSALTLWATNAAIRSLSP